MSRHTVTLTRAADVASVRAALASLPESTRIVDGPTADIHVLSGAAEDWPTAVTEAESAGAIALLVVDPPSSLEGIDELLRVHERLPVALHLPWSGNPALAGREQDASRCGALRLVVASGAVPADGYGDEALTRGAADLVIALSQVAARPVDVCRVHRTTWTLAVSGTIEQAPVSVIVARTDAPDRYTGELGVHGETGALTALIPGVSSATPACLRISDDDGELQWPTRYETALRSSLRGIIAALADSDWPSDVARYGSVLTAFAVAGDSAR